MKAIDVTRVKKTRNGSPARVICSDRLSPEGSIVALVTHDDRESVLTYYANGKYWRGMDHPLDLVEELETVEVDGWVNVRLSEGGMVLFGMLHETPEEAHKLSDSSCIACVRIQRTITKGEGLDAK